ncbi:hypothetical protein [Psychroserpens sp. NJDZ02]|uniref:hypothetical protein n=1 Tax=Psychroserpens sp. NJDZ02 TaxID=2570561 RepID=UPI0010A8D325|nr:hypothetical protein [Psychroserpens sp. NJDZ02]QCE43257.1 hypothetical protein E9099_18150 [Psychroserpens sp. NJDZ02]
MKTLLNFLIVLSSLTACSQRLCELGRYDFITQTIVGVDKVPFSKIKSVDNDKPQNDRVKYVSYYDDFGRLINVDFKGNGHLYGGQNINKECYEIESSSYKYSDTIRPKEIKIKDTREEYSIILSYNKFNKIKTIDYTNDKDSIFSTFNLKYDKKQQLTVIDKGNLEYYYEWDDNSRIKKITTTDVTDPYYIVQETSFTYVNNRMTTIEVIGRAKDNKDDISFHFKFLYTYKNDKLDRSVFQDITYGNSMITIYNYHNPDKLIITQYNTDEEYSAHFECYY